jgi:hypothetical protein
MRAKFSLLIGPLLTVLLIAGIAWWWNTNMEKRWEAKTNTSDAAVKNPMLGATRLLARHLHPVTIEETLSGALLKPSLPAGTMILAENYGVITVPQVNQLLAWVARGNTLIASPTWGGAEDKETDEGQGAAGKAPATKSKGASVFRRGTDQIDQLGQHFGVEQVTATPRPDQICRQPYRPTLPTKVKAADALPEVDCVAGITLPDATYPLRLDASSFKLASHGPTTEMLFNDDDATAVRVFAHGKGRVVFIAENYFNNLYLPLYDHGEFLLDLANLNRDAAQVLIVKRLDVPSWYQALWALAPLALIALGLALLLWAWRAVRRFGPMLPEPDLARRSLMEHVDASSRWLWKTEKGRGILLTAARAATEKILLRRIPELHKLAEQEKIEHLASNSQLSHSQFSHADLTAALYNVPAPRPAEFTRQIQTLQRLRKQYERQP